MTKISENESPRPSERAEIRAAATGASRREAIGTGRIGGTLPGGGRLGITTSGAGGRLGTSTRLAIAGGVLVIIAAAIYIATAGGGAWKSKSNSTATNTPKPSSAVAPAQTCKNKETVAMGYKLFYSNTYKYCIQYPTDWPVDQAKADMVTFGTVPAEEPGPGWLKSTYFTGKAVSARTEEIVASYKEPAGPCTTSDVMLAGESARKLICLGAANGENHTYVLLGHGHDLFEVSYIEGVGEQKVAYDTQYRIMVDSFLTNMFANQ
jgi:hypothetical protein